MSGTTTQPTPQDQYMLELINAARADPTAAASSAGIDLNAGLAAGTIAATPDQPLAFDPALIDSATAHSQDMIAAGFFGHDGSSGDTPDQRMEAAGYTFTAPWSWAENIAEWYGGGTVLDQATTAQLESNLFNDAPHRVNLLNPDMQQVGVGLVGGTIQGQSGAAVTQDFAYSASTPGPFITGVLYTDANGDGAYEPGEEMGGVTVQATGAGGTSYSTTTWDSGGYTLEVPAGTYAMTFSGGGLPNPVTEGVTVGTRNVEADVLRQNGATLGMIDFGTPTPLAAASSGGGTSTTPAPGPAPAPTPTPTPTPPPSPVPGPTPPPTPAPTPAPSPAPTPSPGPTPAPAPPPPPAPGTTTTTTRSGGRTFRTSTPLHGHRLDTHDLTALLRQIGTGMGERSAGSGSAGMTLPSLQTLLAHFGHF
jgi:uncharacterized protein YkwD